MLGVASTPAAYPLRLTNICGYDGRCNNVVYCWPKEKCDNQSVVVYFGGDVQDFTECMQTHRDNKNYIKWNLENTSVILRNSFPKSHILVIKPLSMQYKTFSCFDNFVPNGNCGTPAHDPMHHGLQHLKLLLNGISGKLSLMDKSDIDTAVNISRTALVDILEEDVSLVNTDGCKNGTGVSNGMAWKFDDIQLNTCDIKLVGFSKGCVVLNQFIYEFHDLKTLATEDKEATEMLDRIKDMYWLDGGHSGGKNTWITSKPLLETLSKLGIKIHIHVTPYQIEDDRRPWIKKEERSFYETLCKLDAPIERTVHFPDVAPDLNIHFSILKVFQQNNSSPP